MLKKYGPSVPDETLQKLVGAFSELRQVCSLSQIFFQANIRKDGWHQHILKWKHWFSTMYFHKLESVNWYCEQTCLLKPAGWRRPNPVPLLHPRSCECCQTPGEVSGRRSVRGRQERVRLRRLLKRDSGSPPCRTTEARYVTKNYQRSYQLEQT